jgi:RHS repeat-associated protein
MDSITDPLNRTTLYGWCTCGALTSITDPDGNLTTFNRDLQSRVYQKVFADNTTIDYLFEGQSAPNTVGATSRLKLSTDALGRRTNYSYFIDGNLGQMSYTDTSGTQLVPSTPSVSYTYDPSYNRIATMTDGTGLTTYAYYPVDAPPALGAGKLHTVYGPLDESTIAFTYDELGRLLSQSINGVLHTVAYDSLGRLTTTDNALGHFSRAYDGVTPRLQTLNYPNGQTANFTYFGNNDDRRLQTLQNLGNGAVNLSRFDYTYDHDGQITSLSKVLGPDASGLWFEYDEAKQLLSARDASERDEATRVLDYGYDYAGNKVYDGDHNPQVHPNRFYIPGTNTDYEANNLNQIENIRVRIDREVFPEVDLVYDAVGNMIDDGRGKTFEWDAANRLSAINDSNAGTRSEFAYDGLNRRVKIVEDSGETKQFIWIGTQIAEERDENNLVTRRYSAEGEQRIGDWDAGLYYYSRDHLGSIRELTDSAGSVRASYDYDPYGQRTALNDSLEVDFGYTGHYFHAPSNLYLAPYRAYDATIGRWLSRDPIGEAGGINLYGYVGNNPLNLWDLLGLDAIFLNDSAAVRILGSSHGHGAILIGNNDTGWSYYSKDGNGPGRYGDGNNRLVTYPTFDDFYRSDDASRYDRAVYIPTTADQDLAMTTYGDSHYRDPYSGRTNNCGDLVNDILGAGDTPGAGNILGTTRPNSQYDNFSARPGWTPFRMR